MTIWTEQTYKWRTEGRRTKANSKNTNKEEGEGVREEREKVRERSSEKPEREGGRDMWKTGQNKRTLRVSQKTGGQGSTRNIQTKKGKRRL